MQNSFPSGSRMTVQRGLVQFPRDGTAGRHQPQDVLGDQPLAFLAGHVRAGHPHVEVDAVLGGLAFGYPLEVQPRPVTSRINERPLVAELLFRYPDGPEELLQRGEPFQWKRSRSSAISAPWCSISRLMHQRGHRLVGPGPFGGTARARQAICAEA